MSNSYTGVSADDNLPTAEEIKAKSRDGVKNFLNERKAELDLEDEDINKLYYQRFKGDTFLALKYEMLVNPPLSLPAGPAVKLSELINKIQGGEQPGRLTERELFKLNLLLPKAYELSTKTTHESATRKTPQIPVLRWDTFLGDALEASSSINNTVKLFNYPEIIQPSVKSERTTVDTLSRTMSEINNQRLRKLPKPARWGYRYGCNATLGEPDFILFRADNVGKLESMNDTEVIATVKVKPEQLMVNLVGGTEITKDGQVNLTDEIEHFDVLYNTAVDEIDYGAVNYSMHKKIIRIIRQAFGYMVLNKLQYGMITTYARTWFLKRGDPPNTNKLYISPMIPINQQHTEHQPSFLECMHYFEDVSNNASKFDSSSSAPDDGDDDGGFHPDSDHTDNSDQSDNDDDEYRPPKSKRRKTEPKKESPNTRPKTTTRRAKQVNMENFKNKNDDKLLVDMKNYNCERFYFGEALGFGRSGTVVKAKLCGKSGALKIADLYKDDVKLKEMLNEIKIYHIIFKKIQEIYVPKLLKFGVLHEAFVFMLTSFAGESFARNPVTKEEKRLAIKGLQEIHALGVKHGDIRLDNIMVNRLTGRPRVWWIDFALSEITDNAEDLKTELLELRYLLDLW
ncbi:kinase-like domain-containing protein [Rhizophagus clarus]|uniref:Kinase-like domain-containing protein n=1 Tax=Rhizophagus clarus TaxID=94130 RepID=A0A8H3MBY8_9GLOM|nr:kinase-like domain-containing protein [Rhizophagus clarus]